MNDITIPFNVLADPERKRVLELMFGHMWMGASTAGYSIANSARFRSAGSTYLTRTPGVAGNRKTWTLSFWVKRATLGTNQYILDAAASLGNTADLYFDVTDRLQFNDALTGASINWAPQWRDPSAWQHFVLAFDDTQATNTNRVKLYQNGSQCSTTGSPVWPTQNVDGYVNSANAHNIGRYGPNNSAYADFYLSEAYLIDGQSLTPSSFGKTDSNGVWVPIKYSGTYGTNGCKLEFKSSGALGTDTSGNGNTWTVSGSPVQTVDTPTNNYATWNALDKSSLTLANGNMTASYGSTTHYGGRGSIALPTTGRWYFEANLDSAPSASVALSLGIATQSSVMGPGSTGTWFLFISSANYIYREAANATVTGLAAPAQNQTLQVAYDADNNRVWLGKNNVWVDASNGVTGNPAAGINPTVSSLPSGVLPYVGCYQSALTANFGATAFAYTPPTGFKALCTANLPAVSIKQPSQHFNIALAAGASIKSSSEALYTYFLEWIKDRANSNNHQLIDTVRGTSAVLQSNTTAAETTYSAPSGTSVGWLWKAGGAAVSNTAGSITSQVSVNATAGFSIVTYTGTGANATVGHGLGATPEFIISFCRNNAGYGHLVYHKDLGNTKGVFLDTTGAAATNALYWNNTSPTSTVVTIGGTGNANVSNGSTHLLYCFTGIPGYSKFGSYAANGASDGPFVYCGFRPRFVLIKNTTNPYDWVLIDTARDVINPASSKLYPNYSGAENSNTGGGDNSTTNLIDITATGFKLRTGDARTNGSGTYIFAAFAEFPFGGSNISPSPAR